MTMFEGPTDSGNKGSTKARDGQRGSVTLQSLSD